MAADGTRGSIPAALPFGSTNRPFVLGLLAARAALPEADRPAHRAAMKDTLAGSGRAAQLR